MVKFKGDVKMRKTNQKYQEILKLDKMLSEANIPHILRRSFSGWQVCYPEFDTSTRVCSAIEHSFSYGSDEDLIEIMGLLEEGEGDGEVVGYLTAGEVFRRIKKHYERCRK